jgi:hypothetical protein
MGRYYWNKRQTTDDFKSISISFLKKYWYLEGYLPIRYGTMSWHRGDIQTGSISLSVTVNKESRQWWVRVQFTQTDNDTQEKKDFDYTIPLTCTDCNFWGLRWWFIDPCSDHDTRCSILYLQSNGYFAGRKTLNLAYESQNEGKRGRQLSYLMCMNATKSVALARTIKYPYRNGKPTRKMRRALDLSRRNPTMQSIKKEMDDFFRS